MRVAQPPGQVLVLDPSDNVAVALADLEVGTTARHAAGDLVVREPVRAAHKVALRPIAHGEPVLKYGEVIGIASAPIAAGAHVHVHNVASSRLPGPGA